MVGAFDGDALKNNLQALRDVIDDAQVAIPTTKGQEDVVEATKNVLQVLYLPSLQFQGKIAYFFFVQKSILVLRQDGTNVADKVQLQTSIADLITLLIQQRETI